jgi:hypothetical protein
LTALWANFHAGALLSPVVLAIEAAGEGAEALRARLAKDSEGGEWDAFLMLAAGTFSVLLATLLTPHGFALWGYPGRVTGHPLVTGFITEWFSPNFHSIDLHPLCWLIGLSLAVFVLRGPKPPYRDFPLCGFLLALGLLYRRNMPIFALAACPILAGRTWALLEEATWFRRVNWAWAGIVACSISFTPIVGALSQWPQGGWFQAQTGAFDFPTRAVDYLKAHPPIGPLWNEYRWGGYLIWTLPKVPVFIDGRAEVYYRRHVFDDYVRMHRMQAGWEDVLGKYRIRTILCERWMGIAQVLLRDPDWKPIYEDQQAIILQRRPWEH